jgi:hypothetical protein
LLSFPNQFISSLGALGGDAPAFFQIIKLIQHIAIGSNHIILREKHIYPDSHDLIGMVLFNLKFLMNSFGTASFKACPTPPRS